MATTMPLHPNELRKMLAVASKARHKCLLILLWRAGLRSSEAATVEAADIQELPGGTMQLHIRNGKGGKARYVRLDKRSADFVRPMMAEFQTGAILQTRKGNPPTGQWIRLLIPQIARAAGISRRVHPHALRHSFARDLHDEGFSMREIQVALGHASLATTEVYLRGIGCDRVGERLEGREW